MNLLISGILVLSRDITLIYAIFTVKIYEIIDYEVQNAFLDIKLSSRRDTWIAPVCGLAPFDSLT